MCKNTVTVSYSDINYVIVVLQCFTSACMLTIKCYTDIIKSAWNIGKIRFRTKLARTYAFEIKRIKFISLIQNGLKRI